MKTIRLLTPLVLVMAFSFATGCAQQTVSEAPVEKEKPVVVQEVKEQTLPVKLSYTGLTSSGETKKYSFKVPGKVSALAVHKGDPVHSGQKLASLSQSDLSLALEASNLNLQKAERAVQDAQDTYHKLQQLYAAGALAKSDLDKAKLDLDIKEASDNQAKIDVQSKQQTLQDTDLYSDMDGYVVDVLFKEGEILNAGYPVVIVRSGDQKVSVGLSPEDVKKVQVGTAAELTMGDLAASGTVSRIDQVPDTQSRTYNTEISLTKPFPAENFYLGSTVKVKLTVGGEKGIWIPLASILNDGEDYVYLVQEGRAVKRNLKLINVQEFSVQTEGLKSGEQLVTVGMKDLKEGAKVKVQAGEKQ